MPTEIVTAMIAVAGVMLSAGISVYIARHQAVFEVDKLRTALQSVLGGKLYERRLEVYPDLYEQLSKLIKDIETDRVSRSTLESALSEIIRWDNRHSIFFGAVAGRTCHALRRRFAELLNQPEHALSAQLHNEKERNRLRLEIQELELAMKHELGTYHFESPIGPRTFAPELDYSALNREFKSAEKKR